MPHCSNRRTASSKKAAGARCPPRLRVQERFLNPWFQQPKEGHEYEPCKRPERRGAIEQRKESCKKGNSNIFGVTRILPWQIELLGIALRIPDQNLRFVSAPFQICKG